VEIVRGLMCGFFISMMNRFGGDNAIICAVSCRVFRWFALDAFIIFEFRLRGAWGFFIVSEL